MTALSDRRAVTIAWIFWAAVFLGMSGLVLAGSHRTLVPLYRKAALNWVAGRPLYDGSGRGFLYLPQAAILSVPVAIFPPLVCEVLWRIMTIGTFAVGLRRFSRLAAPRTGADLFPLMTLVSIPLAWDCARNGQSTLVLTGLMLLAVADVAGRQWWRATLWLTLGVALKPLMIVLVLLLMALERPLTWRLAVGLLVMAAMPFFAQRPGYVLDQYAACLHNTRVAAQLGMVDLWAQPFSALKQAGLDVPGLVQSAARVAAALATLWLAFRTRRRCDPARHAVYLFALAATYLMLFNPRSENNSYAMLGPAIGVFLSEALVPQARPVEAVLLAVVAVGVVGSRTIGHLLVPDSVPIWLAPLMASCFCGYLVARILRSTREGLAATPRQFFSPSP